MPDSPLMNEKDVLDYLRVDKKKLTRIMVERGLRRHELTGCFARVQVEAIGRQIEQEIMGEDASTLGSGKPPLDSERGYRLEANLV